MNMPVPFPTKEAENLISAQELKAFMDKHGFGEREMGEFLGVTWQAVRLWVRGERGISLTTSKLIRLFNKYPQLMREFK